MSEKDAILPDQATVPGTPSATTASEAEVLGGDREPETDFIAPNAARFRTFLTVWSAQFVSLVGSYISSFAFGIYAYQQTGSVTVLAVIYVLSGLPLLFASPVTGSLVDRWGPRRSLLVSNIGGIAISLTLAAALLFADALPIWLIFVATAVTAVMLSIQIPAFEVTVPFLVPRKHLDRANGLRQLAIASSQLLAPIAGGFLIVSIRLQGVVILDTISFSMAIVTLLVVRIPRVANTGNDGGSTPGALLKEFKEAWNFIAARRGLVALMAFLGVQNFFVGLVDIQITPMILAFESPPALGTVLTVGGLGMIIASVLMSVLGGPRRRVAGIMFFALVLAVAVIVASVRPNVALVAFATFFFLGCGSVIVSLKASIWQTRVDPRLLGRASAMLTMTVVAPLLLSYAVSGAIADHVLPDQVRSDLLAQVIGQGQGRGFALIMMASGVLMIVLVCLAYAYRPLRRLEEDLPEFMGPADMTSTQQASEK